uniref:Uncharacterized protein n=1 Tax=Physcomitrium patens TaxID=3218 RepID=A0A2K1JIS4_PHYPA|nr:hypothetical protein PHYPA_018860 [Physcomitrium patens]
MRSATSATTPRNSSHEFYVMLSNAYENLVNLLLHCTIDLSASSMQVFIRVTYTDCRRRSDLHWACWGYC